VVGTGTGVGRGITCKHYQDLSDDKKVRVSEYVQHISLPIAAATTTKCVDYNTVTNPALENNNVELFQYVIDISDLDLNVVIKELWRNMAPAAFFMFNNVRPPNEPSDQEISEHLQHSKYIDYLAGRGIKTDFSDLRKVDTRWYNRDAGPDAFEKIVSKLIKT
jgi:hypothetical protein